MDDLFVDRVARRAERGKLAVAAIALQHVALRHWLAADLVGDGALDDGPVHPAGAGFLLDVFKPAIDDRVDGVELALDAFRLVAAAATVAPSRPAIARGTIAPRAIAAAA